MTIEKVNSCGRTEEHTEWAATGKPNMHQVWEVTTGAVRRSISNSVVSARDPLPERSLRKKKK